MVYYCSGYLLWGVCNEITTRLRPTERDRESRRNSLKTESCKSHYGEEVPIQLIILMMNVYTNNDNTGKAILMSPVCNWQVRQNSSHNKHERLSG